MRLMVVDEHPILREALENLLKRQFPDAIIAGAESHEQARAAVLATPFDLVVTDLLCCRAEDLRTLPDLVDAAAPGRVVVFGKCAGRVNARRAQAAGVHGYVPATNPPELVGAAIRLVLAGGDYFPQLPRVEPRAPSPSGQALLERLSPRQREVLRGLEAGQSNKAIAESLGISIATVKLHVQSILKAAGAHNRAEAAALARAG